MERGHERARRRGEDRRRDVGRGEAKRHHQTERHVEHREGALEERRRRRAVVALTPKRVDVDQLSEPMIGWRGLGAERREQQVEGRGEDAREQRRGHEHGSVCRDYGGDALRAVVMGSRRVRRGVGFGRVFVADTVEGQSAVGHADLH